MRTVVCDGVKGCWSLWEARRLLNSNTGGPGTNAADPQSRCE